MKDMSIESLNKTLQEINNDYPWTLPFYLKVTITVIVTIVLVIFIIICILCQTGRLKRLLGCLPKRKYTNDFEMKRKSLMKKMEIGAPTPVAPVSQPLLSQHNRSLSKIDNIIATPTSVADALSTISDLDFTKFHNEQKKVMKPRGIVIQII